LSGSKEMKELLLINIAGPDRHGLTAEITSVLSAHLIPVLDIGQAVIHNHLSLGMLVEIPGETNSAAIMKDLLFKTHTLGLQLTFTPVSETEYEGWIGLQGKERHLLSLLGPKDNGRAPWSGDGNCYCTWDEYRHHQPPFGARASGERQGKRPDKSLRGVFSQGKGGG